MEQPRVSYTFEKCLGRGGYGEVYLATRTRPGGLTTRVAVKVLRSGIARESEAMQRLRDEGRMLAMLDHPSILGVHEMTRFDGRVALVTEYVEGIDVSRCCKRGFLLPARVVLGIIGEVAAALHTAATTPSAETGKPLALIHRDIKPENIRLSKHGEVKLLDFGIARSTEMDREAQTVAGAMPFTPGYAAPECFNEGQHSAASDIFALGATAYRMLAGERLFEGLDTGSQLTLVSHRERYDRFLAKRLGRLDADSRVEDLLEEMLAYDAAARPSAAQVQLRCESLGDSLEGPTHVRWARSTRFSEPRGIPGADLTGRTMEAEDVVDVDKVETVRLKTADLPRPDEAAGGSGAGSEGEARPRAGGASGSQPIGGHTDSLPIPEAGLDTLPDASRVRDVPRPGADSELDTVRLTREVGGISLLVKLGAALIVAMGVLGGMLVLVLVILWAVMG